MKFSNAVLDLSFDLRSALDRMDDDGWAALHGPATREAARRRYAAAQDRFDQAYFDLVRARVAFSATEPYRLSLLGGPHK